MPAYVQGETHKQARADGIGDDQVLLQVKFRQQKLDPLHSHMPTSVYDLNATI